jgi:hypothetical protein
VREPRIDREQLLFPGEHPELLAECRVREGAVVDGLERRQQRADGVVQEAVLGRAEEPRAEHRTHRAGAELQPAALLRLLERGLRVGRKRAAGGE